MDKLKFFNDQFQEKVELKKIYNQILLLKRAEILKLEQLSSLEGYEKTALENSSKSLYSLYYNDQLKQYAVVKNNRIEGIYSYLLDYSDPELVDSLAKKCQYLESSDKTIEDNGYKGLGIIVLVVGVVLSLFAGELALVIIVPALLLSAIYFGISTIIRKLDEVRNSIK